MPDEIIYPAGIWDPLPRTLSSTPLQHLVIDVHTMVTTIEGCRRYFSTSGNPYSHFGLPDSGPVRQWQDLRYRAASDYQGNAFCISIETEDTGPPFPTWTGSNVPAWTPEQVERLANLIAWLCTRFGIPPVLLANSLPNQAGASYHRLGIDPYRVAGGVKYSTSYAKACPGDRRIDQMRNIVMPRVTEILQPTPPPTSLGDLMPFPVIGAANDQNERPWRALLPGKVVTFVDWDPLPLNTLSETWAPGWAYYEGVSAGVFDEMKRAPGDLEYDRRVAVAQQYTRLPSDSIT